MNTANETLENIKSMGTNISEPYKRINKFIGVQILDNFIFKQKQQQNLPEDIHLYLLMMLMKKKQFFMVVYLLQKLGKLKMVLMLTKNVTLNNNISNQIFGNDNIDDNDKNIIFNPTDEMLDTNTK